MTSPLTAPKKINFHIYNPTEKPPSAASPINERVVSQTNFHHQKRSVPEGNRANQIKNPKILKMEKLTSLRGQVAAFEQANHDLQSNIDALKLRIGKLEQTLSHILFMEPASIKAESVPATEGMPYNDLLSEVKNQKTEESQTIEIKRLELYLTVLAGTKKALEQELKSLRIKNASLEKGLGFILLTDPISIGDETMADIPSDIPIPSIPIPPMSAQQPSTTEPVPEKPPGQNQGIDCVIS